MLWPSTPAAPWLRATFGHALSRVVGRMTLSIRLYHLPPLTPLPSADTMRSVQIEASAHHHSRRRAFVPCVALAGTPRRLLAPFRTSRLHLPASLPSGRFCFP